MHPGSSCTHVNPGLMSLLLNTGSLMTTFSWKVGSRVSKPRRWDERVMTPFSCWNSKPVTRPGLKTLSELEVEPKLRPELEDRPELEVAVEEEDGEEEKKEDEEEKEEGFCTDICCWLRETNV